MRSLLTVFYSVFILIGGSVQAQTNPLSQMTEPTYYIDAQATAQAPWEPGSIIAEDNISETPKSPLLFPANSLASQMRAFMWYRTFINKAQLDQVKDFVANTTPIQGTYRQ